MTDANSAASTRTSRVIKAPREALYRAFTDPAALAVWLSPGEMTGKVHEFDARVGGGYRMSLFYPSSEQVYRGKTSERERSEEHTSELQSLAYLVCRLLLEKKKINETGPAI